MAREAFHVLDCDSPLFDWPVLRALEASGQLLLVLGPERARRYALSVAPGLAVLGAASAPGWSVRSKAMALRRTLTSQDGTPRFALTWGDHARDVVARAGIANAVPVPQALWNPAPIQGGTHTDWPDRASARRALGLSDDDLLIAGFGPRRRTDAFRIAHIAGVLSYAGRRVTVALPSDAVGLDRARRLLERHEHAWRVVVSDGSGFDMLPAADVAVCLLNDAGRPLDDAESATIESKAEWCRAFGVQVVRPTAGTGRASDLATARAVRDAVSAGGTAPSFDPERFSGWRRAVEELAAGELRSA